MNTCQNESTPAEPEWVRVPTSEKWGTLDAAAHALVVSADLLGLPIHADWYGDDLIAAPGTVRYDVLVDYHQRREARQAKEREAAERAARAAWMDQTQAYISTQTQQIVVGGKVHVLTLVQAREGTGVEWEVETSSGCRTEMHWWPGTDLSGAVAYIAGIIPGTPEPC